MKLTAFRYTRYRKIVLGVLATIWLTLALHPCAMAYAKYETPGAESQHHCPHCPSMPTNNCELVDWQQSHAASTATATATIGVFPPAIVSTFIALSIWQPVKAGAAPPPADSIGLHLRLPRALQDQLRL